MLDWVKAWIARPRVFTLYLGSLNECGGMYFINDLFPRSWTAKPNPKCSP